MARRWFTLAAISLMLGLLLNIGMTLTLAWAIGHHSWLMQAGQSNHRGAEIVWPEPPPGDWPGAPGGLNRFETWACRLDSFSSAKVTDRVVPPGMPVEIRIYQQNVWNWGWPMRSLKMTWQQAEVPMQGSNGYRQIMPDQASLCTGLPLPEMLWRKRFPTVLPLMPVWAGFAFNSLLYGCVVGALLFGPREIRQFSRRRGNRCLACGYDLAGLAMCPECGAAAWRAANGK